MKGEFGQCAISSFEVPTLKNVRLLFKKQQERASRELQVGQLCFSPFPGKFMEQVLLEISSSRHMEEKKVLSSLHGFTDHNLCLTSLNTFCEEMSVSVYRERKEDVINLGLSKVFDNFSHSIFVSSLGMYGLDSSRQVTVSFNWKLWGYSRSLVFSFGTPQCKTYIVRLKQVQ